jgi:branched-subunit amino acid aminotransferase/4-amino-4-deoxychorismate lyase
VDGRLAPAGAIAAARGLGCVTTAGVSSGRPRLAERHVRRLRRDAEHLGLVPPSAEECHRALATLAAEAFPHGEGIVRLELGPGAGGRTLLVGTTRPLGDDPPVLSAVVSSVCHPGPGPAPGAKLRARAAFDDAFEQARLAGADEAILADRIAREIVLESLAELREVDVPREALADARELVVLNAVRGARPVVELDGRPVGSGRPGSLCAQLKRILAGAH